MRICQQKWADTEEETGHHSMSITYLDQEDYWIQKSLTPGY